MFRIFLIPALIFLTSCNVFTSKKSDPATVRSVDLDSQINPLNQEKSIIQTVPLMNSAVKSLYNSATDFYKKRNFKAAIDNLQRAYEIQPESPQISQFLAEIKLNQGDFNGAHYWAMIATKNSPSKGSICNKSWRILAIVAENLGYYAQQENALEHKDTCILKPQNRF